MFGIHHESSLDVFSLFVEQVALLFDKFANLSGLGVDALDVLVGGVVLDVVDGVVVKHHEPVNHIRVLGDDALLFAIANVIKVLLVLD
jgi:hypothetical protein